MINTIENCYKTIALIGNNQTAKDLYAYLINNKSISIFWIRQSEGTVNIDNDCEIAIFTYPFIEPATNQKGIVYSVFYDKLVNGEIEHPFFDI